MKTFDADTIYGLLPLTVRMRDEAQGIALANSPVGYSGIAVAFLQVPVSVATTEYITPSIPLNDLKVNASVTIGANKGTPQVVTVLDIIDAVSTTATTAIAAGSVVVTPASMQGIAVGVALQISGGAGGAAETVKVAAVTATTFTATFAHNHPGPYFLETTAPSFQAQLSSTPEVAGASVVLAAGPLRALIGMIAAQANVVDDNLYQLYDDLFVETCSPWAIPYIGDLIGYRPLRPIPPGEGPARVDVADTIGLRRRKGTLVMLDQLARDVTGWPAVAVEFFALVAVSQYVRNHVRLQNACVDVHGYQTAIDINGAFDLATRSVDVRRSESGRGRYNIPNIGMFVWRLAAFGGATLGLGPASAAIVNKLVASSARNLGPNMYTFDPFGDDVALVNPPQPLAEFGLPAKQNVPYRLPRYPLYDELEALRAGTLAPDQAVFFGAAPVLAVYDAAGAAIAPKNMAVCDLSHWTPPTDPAIHVAVDPELGRMTFNLAVFTPPKPLRVSYAYVFSGEYGGGTYVRAPDPGEGSVTLSVANFATSTPDAWAQGVIEIGDSGLFLGDVTLKPTKNGLVVRAEDEARPVIAGNLTIVAIPGGSVTLRGLGVGGRLTIVTPPHHAGSSSASSMSSSSLGASSAQPNDPAFTLNVEHCTIRGALSWTYSGGGTLRIDHSLSAALFVDPTIDITISDSVVDAGIPAVHGGSSSASAAGSLVGFDAFAAIAGASGSTDCGNLQITASTVFGDVLVREIVLIENSIITGNVVAARTQTGCVRYSYLPPPPYSRVPPRFRCEPDLAIDAAVAAALKQNPSLRAIQAQAIGAAITEWLVPTFTSRRKSDGGYAQLAESCPVEIATGAESEDEMGAFHGLYAPRRESNLRFRLDEYLRIGLEAGIIHAS